MDSQVESLVYHLLQTVIVYVSDLFFKVILWTSSEGSSPTASGLTYRSSNEIRKDNPGKAHEKVTHRCSSIMDHD